MKDRDGNEFKSVPADGHWDMTQAALALLKSKNCGDLTVGDLAAAISNAIAAAPQFVAGEVDDAMAHRIAETVFGQLGEGRVCADDGRKMIAAVRAELGLALGLVSREELAAQAHCAASADAKITALQQSITIRDTEIARLETDLELARREVKRLGDALDLSALEYADLAVSAKSLEEHLHALVEVSEDSTIARARAVMNGDDIGEDADDDAARAGNGGGV